jgi:hypothetical protein
MCHTKKGKAGPTPCPEQAKRAEGHSLRHNNRAFGSLPYQTAPLPDFLFGRIFRNARTSTGTQDLAESVLVLQNEGERPLALRLNQNDQLPGGKA